MRVGLNRDDLKNAKRALGIVALRDRDSQTGRTTRWRWSMPTVAPTPTPTPRPLIPHRWGVYSYNQDGRYYYRQEQAETFEKLELHITQRRLEPPLWVLLTSAPTDAELAPLPIRLLDDAIPALAGRWKKLDELIRRRRPVRGRARARRLSTR